MQGDSSASPVVAYWTEVEDAILRQHYVPAGAVETARLVGRTVSATCHRAKRLGLCRVRRWTAAEDNYLRNSWGHEQVTRIARKLNRKATAIYWRAGQLGLARGCPDGFEYLTEAAARTGYSTQQLRMILRWARIDGAVGIHRSLSRPTGARRSYHFVEPFDLDQAIAKWNETETVHAAARARGLVSETLADWLREARAAGVPIPAKPEQPKAHWRIPSVLIDQVLAARATTESVAAAAVRLDVTRQTITSWLHAAGVPRGTTRVWRLPRRLLEDVAVKARSRPSSRARAQGRAA